MVGTLPKTALLLTRHHTVIGSFDSYFAVAQEIGFHVSDDGVVMFDDVPQNPTYIYDPTGDNPNAFFSKDDILRDWARSHMAAPGYKIYRYLA